MTPKEQNRRKHERTELKTGARIGGPPPPPGARPAAAVDPQDAERPYVRPPHPHRVDASSGQRTVTGSVDLESESNIYTGFTNDVSEGGVFIATDDLLDLGTRISIEFSLPDDPRPVRVRGSVRWLRVENPNSDFPPGMGIQFLDLADDDRHRIARFVELREPLFYDD
jgi:uncharacterized protein (TIGR02266 family)